MGCRARAAKATLLRVVGAGGVLVPDPAGRLPGRGASVHLDLQCVALAERRRAFPRALRLDGPLDVTPVRDHVAAHVHDRTDPRDPGAPSARREQAEP